MSGLDTSTTPHCTGRVIAGRFPASPLDPPPPIGPLLAEVIARPPSPGSQKRYRECLDCWLTWRAGQPVTLPRDLAQLRTLDTPQLRALTPLLLSTTEGDISAYLAHLASTGYQPSTINTRITILRLLFQRLERAHLTDGNPADSIRSRRVAQDSATAWLTSTQARQLLSAITGDTPRDRRDRAILALMLHTGLRCTEARTALAEDLALVGPHTVLAITGKGGARERVKLTPSVASTIRAWLAVADFTTGPLFRRLDRTDRPVTPLSPESFAYIIRSRYARAGLPATLVPHSLRHTFVTLAIQGGAPLPKVQKAARHRKPETTMRYAHALDGLDDHAADYITI